MKRIKILFGQRRFQVLATLTGVIMAVAVVMASGASFTAHSANAEQRVLHRHARHEQHPERHVRDRDQHGPRRQHTTAASPSQNTGDVQGHFYLEPVTITGDTMDGKFADDLQVVINDGKDDIYKGTLSGLKQDDLGVWQPKDQNTYTFHGQLPRQRAAPPAPRPAPAAIGNDNQYMGASTTVDFNWTAVSVPVGEIAGK